MFSTSVYATLGTLIYEDGKATTGLALDAGTCLVVLPKTKCLGSVFSTFSYRTATSIA